MILILTPLEYVLFQGSSFGQKTCKALKKYDKQLLKQET